MKKFLRSAVVIAISVFMSLQLVQFGLLAAQNDCGFGLEINTSDHLWNTHSDGSGSDLQTYTVGLQYKGSNISGVQSMMIAFDASKLMFVPFEEDGGEFRTVVSDYEDHFEHNDDVEEYFYKMKDQIGGGIGNPVKDKWSSSGIVPVISYAELNGWGFIYLIISQEASVEYSELTTVCEVRLAKNSTSSEISANSIRVATTNEANSLNASTSCSMALSDGSNQTTLSYFDNKESQLSAPVYSGDAGIGSPSTDTPDTEDPPATEDGSEQEIPTEAKKLPAPTNPAWSNSVATWNAVDGASAYLVQLYKNNSVYGDPITAISTSCNFASQMTETGNYSFTVIALGDGVVYADSNASTQSGTNAFSGESEQDTLSVSAAVAGILGGRRSYSSSNIADQSAKTASVQEYVSETIASIPKASGVLSNVEHKSGNIYTVTLTKGRVIEEKDIEVIFEAAPSIAELRLNTARDLLASAEFPAIIEGAAYSEVALKNYVKGISQRVINDDEIEIAVETVQYTAAVSGTQDDPDGENGSYLFTITLTKDSYSKSTARIKIDILAYEHGAAASDRAAVSAARNLIAYCWGEFTVPFGAQGEDLDNLSLIYVNTLLADKKESYGVKVSLEKIRDEHYNVLFSCGEESASVEMSIFPEYLEDREKTLLDKAAETVGDKINAEVSANASLNMISQAVNQKLIKLVANEEVTVSAKLTADLGGGKYEFALTLGCKDYTAEKTVIAEMSYVTYLDAPEAMSFNNGIASWDKVLFADGYSVQLYKDGYPYGKAYTTTNAEYDFSSVIFAKGNYSFTVTTIGSGMYGNSKPSAQSGIYAYTQALGQLTGNAAYLLSLPDKQYQISVSVGEGGTVSPSSNQTVKQGYNKTFIITPLTGYEVEDIVVDGRSVGSANMHVFCAVDADHSISVTFKKTASTPSTEDVSWDNPFTDISESDKFYNAIKFVNLNSLFYGTSKTQFSPDVTMTRAMFVTVLGRLYGLDTAKYYGEAFSDLVAGEYYCPYVKWASEEGLVLGYGDGTFGPNDIITHEQMYSIMKRYADMVGVGAFSDQTMLVYADTDKISSWAINSVKYCKAMNIIDVASNGNIDPQGEAKRSEVAVLLYLFCKNVLN